MHSATPDPETGLFTEWKVDAAYDAREPTYWHAWRARRIGQDIEYERAKVRRAGKTAKKHKFLQQAWVDRLCEKGLETQAEVDDEAGPLPTVGGSRYRTGLESVAESSRHSSTGRQVTVEERMRNLDLAITNRPAHGTPAAWAHQIGRAGAATALPPRTSFSAATAMCRPSSRVLTSEFSLKPDERIRPGVGVRRVRGTAYDGPLMLVVLVVQGSRFLAAPVYENMKRARFMYENLSPSSDYIMLHTDEECPSSLHLDELAVLAYNKPMRFRLFMRKEDFGGPNVLFLDLVDLQVEPPNGDEDYDIVGSVSRKDMEKLINSAQAVDGAREQSLLDMWFDRRAAPEEPVAPREQDKAIRRWYNRR